MPEEPSPYASPYSSLMEPVQGGPPLLPAAVPAQIKVLGILDLVFAGLGLLLLVFGMVMQLFTQSMWAQQEKAGGVEAAQAKMTHAMMDSMRTFTWIQNGLSLVLAILLILAGRGLLKRRKAGLKWSNLYAWTAIVMRLAGVAYFIVAIMPKINAIVGNFDLGAGSNEMIATGMKVSMTAGPIGGSLLYCIYPVLVLILLNRERVRKALS